MRNNKKLSLQIFGYEEGSIADSPTRLREVTLVADASTLRRIGLFLMTCSEEMKSDQSWDHRHFKDSGDGTSRLACDVIVARGGTK